MIQAGTAELSDPSAETHHAHAAPASLQSCGECLGSGGWYRYEPALDPAPGLLYLSCIQCHGTGRTARLRD